MKTAITHSELILYYYNECSADCKAFIDNNLSSNPSWSAYLEEMAALFHEFDFAELPHPTTSTIILEESQSFLQAVSHD
ncbi:MAG: hypothetical protein RL577_461 [Bacteroidota bacterium]|jgi:hypothetical protein